MNTQTDQQLLQEYVARQSDDAFTTLVHRNMDLVHTAAMRVTNGNEHLSQDVAQEVFKALSERATQLMDRPSLEGWLLSVTHTKSVDAVRAQERRRRREQQAAAMTPIFADGSDDPWKEVAPQLDGTLLELPEAEREAVIQYYFKHRKYPEIAKLLGTTEQAVQKRVSRGIERLRELFAQRGVNVTTGVLGSLIWANAVQSAPAGLAASVAAALTAAKVATATAAATTSATTATTKLVTMTALKSAVVVTTLVGLLGGGVGIHQARQAKQLRAVAQASAQQAASATERADETQRKLDEAEKRATGEEKMHRQFQAQVATLRGQVARLEADNAALNRVLALDIPEDRAWNNLAAILKERAKEAPAMQIPELQLAVWRDWLDATKDPIAGDDDNLEAFSEVRGMVEDKFARHVYGALTRCMAASGGKFPTKIEQLAPYFDPPQDPAILVRWQVVAVKDEDVETTESGRIIRLTPMDPLRDEQWAVDENGPRSSRTRAVPVPTDKAQ